MLSDCWNMEREKSHLRCSQEEDTMLLDTVSYFMVLFAVYFQSWWNIEDKPRSVRNGAASIFDVGFHSVCYEYVLLTLINKEAVLAYGGTEYS